MGKDTFINYLMLAQAILMSDFDDGTNYVICLYDALENDRLIGVFNNYKSCAMMLNCNVENLKSHHYKNLLFRGRFKVEGFDCGTTSNKLEYYKFTSEEIHKRKLFRIYFRKWRKWL